MSNWRPVVGYEDLYLISDEGLVYAVEHEDSLGRRKGGKILTQYTGARYPTVALYRAGERRTKRIHELVITAFVGPCPEDAEEVRHLDGNPFNNRLANLRYGTKVENAQDALRHGTNRSARKTHCKHGHEFNEANTIIRKNGNRDCQACHDKQWRKWSAQNRKKLGVALKD